MVFSSIVFLLYFLPIFFTLYFIVDVKFKNILILLASILFYSWGAPLFIFVIIGTTFLDFHFVKWMYQAKKKKLRVFLLILSISMNLGLLFYFKYSFFLIDNINVLLNIAHVKNIAWQEIALPIGISFFTFESLTYVIDVYRGVHAPLKKFWNYQLYIILFPKLIAGPIVRFHDIADQITDRFKTDSVDNKLTGLYQFIMGLSKKVIIANTLAVYADSAFTSDIATLSTGTAWFGILCYTFQIYFDFSGYSDMAIGLLKMMNFTIPENFNLPYSATSITDFWRRWHISLGTWMRNYLYIPLGGNKVSSTSRLYFNLVFVFLASGLWHGASWNFIFWGAYHGFWLVLERAFLLKLYAWFGAIFRTAFTFVIVVLGWVFFRTENWTQATAYLTQLFAFEEGAKSISITPQLMFFFTLAMFFSFLGITSWGNKLTALFYRPKYSLKQTFGWGFICLVLFTLSVSILASNDFNPFIYFRF